MYHLSAIQNFHMKRLLIFIILCFTYLPFSYSQWYIKHQGDKNLHVVKFLNDTLGFAMGDNSLILKTTDTGETWTICDFPDQIDFRDYQYINDTTIVACGQYTDDFGLIYKSSDLGNSWECIHYESGPILSLGYFDSLNHVAVNRGGIIWTNDGTNYNFVWDFYQSEFNWGDLFSISVVNDSIAYACGWGVINQPLDIHGIILKTYDKGETWDYVYNEPDISCFYYVYALNEDTLFLSTGGIHSSTDGGQTLYSMNVYNLGYRSIDFSNYPVGYAVGGSEYMPINEISIIKSTDGNNWDIQVYEEGYPLESVYFINQDVGFAVGWNEMILKTTTGGGIIVNNQSHNVSIQRIKIFPNPTNDYFIIDLTDSNINNANIDIFDISGKPIFSKYIYNTNKFIVDGFPMGIYLIKITSNNNVTTEKIVIY